MVRVLTVAGAMVVALVVSWFLRRRKIDAPTQGGFELPVQLDRNDLVVADAAGVVKAGFLGPVKAQDLWAAVAECREPGSSPGSCQNHG